MSGTVISAADRPGSFLVTMDGMPQSHVDLADPTRLVFDYVRCIGDIVDAMAPPRPAPLRVVHAGGAGLTLARYVHATRPGSRQTVLEPDSGVTEMVRDLLPLPRRSGIKVRPIDGRTGLDGLARADLVVVDAFAGGRTPEELVSVEALSGMLRIADVVVLNLVDRAPFVRLRRVLAGIGEAQPSGEARLVLDDGVLRGRRAGNLVVAVGAAAPDISQVLIGSTYRVLSGVGLRDRFGGGEPIRDVEIGWTPAQTPRTSP